MKNNNNKIIPIYTVLGKSGSGKSTVVKILESFKHVDTEKDIIYKPFRRLMTYTTRPQRNVFDMDYIFIKRPLFEPYASTDSIIRKHLRGATVISDISYNVIGGEVWRYILAYDDYMYDTINTRYIVAASIGQFMDMWKHYMYRNITEKDTTIFKPIPIIVQAISESERLKTLYERASEDKDKSEVFRRELFGPEFPNEDVYMEIFKELGYTDYDIIVIENKYEGLDVFKRNISCSMTKTDIIEHRLEHNGKFAEDLWDLLGDK